MAAWDPTEHRFSAEIPHPRLSIQLVSELLGHTAGVKSVRFSPESTLLLSADGHTLGLWEGAAHESWVLQRFVRVPAEMLRFSPTGATFAFSERFGGVQVWSREGTRLAVLLDKKQGGLDVAFSPDGTLIATSDNQGRVLLWSTDTYDLCCTLQLAPEREAGLTSLPVYALSFSPDGTRLAFCCRSKQSKVQIWSVHTFASAAVELRLEWISSLNGPDERIHDLAFSPDGQVLAVATRVSRCVWLFDAQTFATVGRLIIPLQDSMPVVMAFSPDGRWLAVAADDGIVWIWSVARQQVITSFGAHTGKREDRSFTIGALDWSGSGTLLATGYLSPHLAHHPQFGLVTRYDRYAVKLWEVQIEE